MSEQLDIHLEHDTLKLVLERLRLELEQMRQQETLSAQYGLALLEEKENLLQRCIELETRNETVKNELELLRQVRQESSRVGVEKEIILQENINLAKNCYVSEKEKITYKAELKEPKLFEARLSSDNNELEEENISLQKQIPSLRSSQVEFEGAKHEVRCLHEEVEAAKRQIEELISLKQIMEKQLEEALEALQSERESKYALKKELDQRINSEPMFIINNFGFSGFGLGSLNQDDGNHSDVEGDDKDTTLTPLSLSTPYENNLVKPQSSTVGDFSELHLSEIHKLEKKLEMMENDKTKISNQLQETQQILAKTEAELIDQNNRVRRMAEHINALIDLHGKLDDMEDPEKDSPEISRLKHLLTKHEQRYQLAVQQVIQLQNDLRMQQQSAVKKDESTEKLKNEISGLKI